MSAIANLRLHGDAIIAKLTAAGVVVGDAEPPTVPYGWRDDATQPYFIPYAIVYPMPGTFDGTLAEPNDDADLVYQVTCVGESRASCSLIEDKVNTALLPGALTITGRSVVQVRVELGGGIRRDDTVQPPVFISTPRFRLSTTPA